MRRQFFSLFLGLFVYAMRTKATCGNMMRDSLELKEQLKKARNEVRKVKHDQTIKISGRNLKHEGFYPFYSFDAWENYRASVEANNAERKNASCKRLGRFFSLREKRSMAVRLVRWRMAAATMSAATDKTPSEGGATDGEDKGSASASSDDAGNVVAGGGG